MSVCAGVEQGEFLSRAFFALLCASVCERVRACACVCERVRGGTECFA